jgi:hypothetical protein
MSLISVTSFRGERQVRSKRQLSIFLWKALFIQEHLCASRKDRRSKIPSPPLEGGRYLLSLDTVRLLYFSYKESKLKTVSHMEFS